MANDFTLQSSRYRLNKTDGLNCGKGRFHRCITVPFMLDKDPLIGASGFQAKPKSTSPRKKASRLAGIQSELSPVVTYIHRTLFDMLVQNGYAPASRYAHSKSRLSAAGNEQRIFDQKARTQP